MKVGAAGSVLTFYPEVTVADCAQLPYLLFPALPPQKKSKTIDYKYHFHVGESGG
jgi:hypothetical protein